LCPPCWKDAKANGDLPDYERKLRPRDEVLDEWDFLRRSGVTRAEAAERMGIRLDSLDKQIWRASKDGDPRAVYGTRGHVPTTTPNLGEINVQYYVHFKNELGHDDIAMVEAESESGAISSAANWGNDVSSVIGVYPADTELYDANKSEVDKTAEAVAKAHAACSEAVNSRQDERATELNRWNDDDRATGASRGREAVR
jgi:hypothetical protein